MRASLSKGFRSLFHSVVEAWVSKENCHWQLLHCLAPGALAVAAACSQPSSQQPPSFLKPRGCPLHHGSRDRTMLSKHSPPSFCCKCIWEDQHQQLPHFSFWENWKSFNFFLWLRSQLCFRTVAHACSWEAHGTWNRPWVFPQSCPALLKLPRAVAGFLHKSPCGSRHATGRPGGACEMESSVPVIVTQHRRTRGFHCGLAGKWWKKAVF